MGFSILLPNVKGNKGKFTPGLLLEELHYRFIIDQLV